MIEVIVAIVFMVAFVGGFYFMVKASDKAEDKSREQILDKFPLPSSLTKIERDYLTPFWFQTPQPIRVMILELLKEKKEENHD